jgi:hypothetical protein
MWIANKHKAAAENERQGYSQNSTRAADVVVPVECRFEVEEEVTISARVLHKYKFESRHSCFMSGNKECSLGSVYVL